ncbi:MAG TPA: holo-ACP synthase [Bacteroidota bacterium]|nr:holo-ACP synthase [Bacteroidota bacterium]
MIEGVGVDVVEIPRMQRAIDTWGSAFLKRIFTDNELLYAQSKKNPTPHIAARFAVKEAVAKALTTGWSGGFRWKDVEIINDTSGRPTIVLYGNVKELLKGSRVLVSISHSENVVIGFALIENNQATAHKN